MSSTAGTRKARVFPEPVLAAPTRSFPSRRCGMALAWMPVMWVKPISEMPLRVFSDTWPDREAKVLSERMPLAPAEEPGTGNREMIYR